MSTDSARAGKDEGSNLKKMLDLEFELLHVGHAPVNEENDGIPLCLGGEGGGLNNK